MDLVEYIRNYPVFGDHTVSFVFACMRHDLNWRNLYRVEVTQPPKHGTVTTCETYARPQMIPLSACVQRA